jgi:vitamin K-dependent gamma-carboxylase
MNHRFNQRQLDPRVDLAKAKWSPFEQTEWVIPLQTELSDWRSKLKEIEAKFREANRDFELTFIADLNGLKLENYISGYLNASIEVLKGQVNVEIEIEEDSSNAENKTVKSEKKSKKIRKQNVTLGIGEKFEVDMHFN